MSKKAYAVRETPLKRSESYSPLSAQWTLYDPKKLANKLYGFVVATLGDNEKAQKIWRKTVHKALEETGFSKAVRIREEVIKLKERLKREQREVNQEIEELTRKKRNLVQRNKELTEQLENMRNILRIPREHPSGDINCGKLCGESSETSKGNLQDTEYPSLYDNSSNSNGAETEGVS